MSLCSHEVEEERKDSPVVGGEDDFLGLPASDTQAGPEDRRSVPQASSSERHWLLLPLSEPSFFFSLFSR